MVRQELNSRPSAWQGGLAVINRASHLCDPGSILACLQAVILYFGRHIGWVGRVTDLPTYGDQTTKLPPASRLVPPWPLEACVG